MLAQKYDVAVGLYKELIAKEPNSPDLELRLAECYRRMQNTEAALEHFRRVQELQPNNPDAAIWVALLLHMTGHEAEARERYQDIIRLQPDNAVARTKGLLRVQANDFPHEIGIFLGYPLKDVLAFMGQVRLAFSCQGPWKIYGKPDQSLELADRYRHCRCRMAVRLQECTDPAECLREAA